MEKKVKIEGKEFRLVANGATPRVYRSLFKKDIFNGMSTAVNKDGEIQDSEVFENLTFCMAVQGGSVPMATKIEDWLGEFDSPMAILNIADQVMNIWLEETETTSTEKKE